MKVNKAVSCLQGATDRSPAFMKSQNWYDPTVVYREISIEGVEEVLTSPWGWRQMKSKCSNMTFDSKLFSRWPNWTILDLTCYTTVES